MSDSLPYNPLDAKPRPRLKENSRSEDLGLGTKAAAETRGRFLNQDGTFNVLKTGRPFFATLHLYHSLLTMSWARFYVMIFITHLAVNALFAVGYVLAGPNALTGARTDTLFHRGLDAFYFSVQTFSTIGYGAISPKSDVANWLVVAESLLGFTGVAIATGLLFARFSRPRAKVIFSRKAVIAPYQDKTAFEFRIANERKSQLSDVSATIVFVRRGRPEEGTVRKVFPLDLERDRIMFLALHWVIVHPIDENSPLWGMSQQDLAETDGEFLILINATDETYTQTVQVRSSYKPEDIEWGRRFEPMYEPPRDGRVVIDLSKIHSTIPAE